MTMEGPLHRTKARVTHKHYQLDGAKIRRAQKVLRARTETETIERALDKVLDDAERDRLAREAHERFLKSGIEILDVFGKLDR
jgi:hypothetical protein